MSKTALVVMARYPTPGRVKTRLARAIGDAAACALYRAFLDDIGSRFGRRSDLDLVWAFEPADADFAGVVGQLGRCFGQQGANLGERMHFAFEQLFGAGYSRVIMMGSDVPHLADDIIEQAFEMLERADVVLGPSEDGGYYLVAMRDLHDIFKAVAMGSAQVFTQTQGRIEALRLSLGLLPRNFDIDEVGDLRRLRDLLLSEVWGKRLPATARCLGAMVLPEA